MTEIGRQFDAALESGFRAVKMEVLFYDLVTDRDAKTPANGAADRVLDRALARGLAFKTTLVNGLPLPPACAASCSPTCARPPRCCSCC